ncbi:MAG: hypothetical protein AAFV53_23100 [Myxococcota bacterium]
MVALLGLTVGCGFVSTPTCMVEIEDNRTDIWVEPRIYATFDEASSSWSASIEKTVQQNDAVGWPERDLDEEDRQPFDAYIAAIFDEDGTIEGALGWDRNANAWESDTLIWSAPTLTDTAE